MAANLASPLLMQSTPFNNETAWLDFLHQCGQWHYELSRATGTAYILLDDLRDNLTPHASLHNQVADALGVTRVADLESFDLRDETSFISFMFLESQDLQRFRGAAGL